MKFWLTQAPPPLGDSVRPGRYWVCPGNLVGPQQPIAVHSQTFWDPSKTHVQVERLSKTQTRVPWKRQNGSKRWVLVFGSMMFLRSYIGLQYVSIKCRSGQVARTCEIFRSSLGRRWADVRSPSRNDRSCWDLGGDEVFHRELSSSLPFPL